MELYGEMKVSRSDACQVGHGYHHGVYLLGKMGKLLSKYFILYAC